MWCLTTKNKTNKKKKTVKWEGKKKKQQTVHFLGYLEIQISVLFEQRTLHSLDTWVSVLRTTERFGLEETFKSNPMPRAGTSLDQAVQKPIQPGLLQGITQTSDSPSCLLLQSSENK